MLNWIIGWMTVGFTCWAILAGITIVFSESLLKMKPLELIKSELHRLNVFGWILGIFVCSLLWPLVVFLYIKGAINHIEYNRHENYDYEE